ncbi:MAG TPA: winged helix DNA-binding domain-containing protein [Mycobacteriales bacterium]|nr:winged helix DNA-binding domain-containing protein [Mycobacteriales bacterium]
MRSDLAPVARERLAAQLLTGPPARTPYDVVERLLAVQAQDARGARLAVRARSVGLYASDVDRALNDRELVVSWLNRGTLHLVGAEDYWWLHELTTPQLATGNATRLRQEGVDADAAERGVAAVVAALASYGPLTRAALREYVAEAGVRAEGQALVHLLFLATLRGHVVRGPMVGKEQAFVLVDDWLGRRPAVDRDVALAELARRYLRGHAPASDRDLAKWAGIPLRDARAGLRTIESEIVARDDGLVALALSRPRAGDGPAPRLLGAYEPLLLGWTSREHVLGHEAQQRLVADNGLFRPFALVGGRAVATWSLNGEHVSLSPFAEMSSADDEEIRKDADAVVRFLNG